MSKELEAFKRIKSITYDRADLYGIEVFREDLNIIEKALKRLTYIDENRLSDEDIHIVQGMTFKDKVKCIKKLKALEIIKDKKVDCNTLIFYLEKHNETGHIDYAFDSYNDYAKDSDKPQLTKEEFDLLKEVLISYEKEN